MSYAPADSRSLIIISNSAPETYTSETDITFDTTDRQRGDLTRSGSQILGLKANKTYLVMGVLSGSGSLADDALSAQIYDVTGTAYLGSLIATSVYLVAATTTNTIQPLSYFLFTPTVNTTVSFRMKAGGSGTATVKAKTSLMVIEL